MSSALSLLLLLIVCVSELIQPLPLPLNQYAYMLARNELRRSDSSLMRLRAFSDKERQVNLYFEKQKDVEFMETKSFFFPARPIEENLDKIFQRPLYKLLKTLPKGGNMHMHEFQMLDRKRFLEMIKRSSDDYDMVYLCLKAKVHECQTTPKSCDCIENVLRYFKKNIPKGFVKVKESGLSLDDIVKRTTLTGLLNSQTPKIYATDTGARWKLANDKSVFDIYSDLTRYNKTRFDYMKEILDSCREENVQLIELRRSAFSNLYYFDENGDQKTIGPVDQVNAIERFKQDYLAQHDEFIDFVFLIYNLRALNKASLSPIIESVINFQKQYPRLIRGFDLVGEEDAGHTFLYHIDSLIKGYNYTSTSNNTFNYMFHTSETNWPDDLTPSSFGDDVSSLENSYDALVLNTHRIGHGIGYYKHPELYGRLIKSKVAIEVCPASNQILGYVSDLRNHPAVNYFRSGIPIVFGGDDPGSFGYNELTLEFYLAYMAWGLNLADLKQIALNSITYSTLPDDMIELGYQKFSKKWDEFVDTTYETKVCGEKRDTKFNTTDILPSYAPFNRTTKVIVFGEGFDTALCKELVCLFGDVQVPAKMERLREIMCMTPTSFSANEIVELKLKVDDYEYLVGTFQFLTVQELMTPDDDATTTTRQTTRRTVASTNTNEALNLKSSSLALILSFILLILIN